ncbi:hypothetical protein Dshi_2551 [Dinoroseobacter shibae DFL 12 = DSM 16493]|jgi:hypothetical protein|uniref:Phage tail protein n=1 Tax=Dinoroseobacter shibae (strain DSM 16493 / NCIMB 14021 / DFL 12) TaxID=398580 RepID=A8LST5_DINSH|nr:hypothetical protein [Dinoroseobacter shibae]ABV94284.1 hypothetical protein Dshi_2551 [Dinoroseobacter shibae DFL 12 = DSM 16493]URF45720.1 hypothetical protein M8008_13155 [Dinoroseobacter shibae]URF50025.1 hypothetical protein M8007_13155 [Dinoroseobacter shibae]
MPEDFAQTLYRILPAYYRQRDETGDLKTYLAGCGALLDAVHATLRQRYADNFPDAPDPGAQAAQDWLLPYFADLVDARLVSPLPDGRRDELAHAIRWRQGKGTLATLDSIIEAIGQTEAVVQEGWQRVAMTPRIDRPLRPARSLGYGQEPAGSPANHARHPDLPAATVDMRCPSRAMAADPNRPGVQRARIDGVDRVWRQGAHHGAPCFPGSFEDISPRTPDMRTPDWRVGHFHPRRVLAFLPPPSGFFPPSAEVVTWQDTPSAGYLARIEIDTETEPGVVIHRNMSLVEGPFRPVQVQGSVDLDLAETQGTTFRFEGISFTGAVTSATARLEFYRCAMVRAATERVDLLEPALWLRSCLTQGLSAPEGRVRLEGVTVLGPTVARAVEASEALFDGPVHAPDNDTAAPPDGGCLRYSRILPDQPAGLLQLRQVTTEAPAFFSRDFPARHVGVLSPATHPALLTGAEDGGEIGAFHEARHAAVRSAIHDKLSDFLPVGQEVVLIPDIRLTAEPWSPP